MNKETAVLMSVCAARQGLLGHTPQARTVRERGTQNHSRERSEPTRGYLEKRSARRREDISMIERRREYITSGRRYWRVHLISPPVPVLQSTVLKSNKSITLGRRYWRVVIPLEKRKQWNTDRDPTDLDR